MQLAQSHPGVVAFYGSVRHGSCECYIQEAMRGDLLDRVLDRNGLSESETQMIVIQLLQALRWLHSKGIVHGYAPPCCPRALRRIATDPPTPLGDFPKPLAGVLGQPTLLIPSPSPHANEITVSPTSHASCRDVKPENILCCGHNSHRVKLADFGLAAILPPGEVAVARPQHAGSALYAAPEENVSFTADMWAVGITTYVLVSANFPYGSAADARTLAPSFAAACWQAISPYGVQFIAQMLLRDPTHRPTAAEALQLPWLSAPGMLGHAGAVVETVAFAEIPTSRKHARDAAASAAAAAGSDGRRKRPAMGHLCLGSSHPASLAAAVVQ